MRFYCIKCNAMPNNGVARNEYLMKNVTITILSIHMGTFF